MKDFGEFHELEQTRGNFVGYFKDAKYMFNWLNDELLKTYS